MDVRLWRRKGRAACGLILAIGCFIAFGALAASAFRADFVRAEAITAEGEEEFDDPFGSPNDDPFGDADDDPFGGAPPFNPPPEPANPIRPEDRIPPEVKKSLAAQIVSEHLQGLRSKLYPRDYEFNDSDGALLDDGLQLLHYAYSCEQPNHDDLWNVFARFAGRGWRQPGDPWEDVPAERKEKPADAVKRLLREAEIVRERMARLPQCGTMRRYSPEAYREYTDEPWPFDWKRKEELWRAAAEAVFASLNADNSGKAWRKRIEADPENKTLYQLAHLGMLRGFWWEEVDVELVADYVRGAKDDPQEQVARICRALASLENARVAVDHPQRATLGEQLRDALTAPGVNLPRMLLLHVVNLKRGRCDHELKLIAPIFLNLESPEIVAQFVEWTGGSPTRFFLRREASIHADNAPFNEVFDAHFSQVLLSVWVDNAVMNDDTPITQIEKGTWFELLERLLDRRDYRFVPLEEDVFWIGPAAKQDEMERFVQRARAKRPLPRHRISGALDARGSHEFFETPLEDVALVLADRFNCSIFCFGAPFNSRDEQPLITSCLWDMPLHLSLAILLEGTGYDWMALENTIVIGKPDELQGLQTRLTAYRRAWLMLPDGDTARVLENTTSFEFYETPLEDVVGFLQDKHGVRFIRSRQLDSGTPITASSRGVTLGEALLFLAANYQFHFCFDEYAIYVAADAKAIEAYQRLSATRRARRAKYPDALRDRLLANVSFEFFENSPDEMANFLETKTGVSIVVDPPVATKGIACSLACKDLPLDAALDLIALDTGLRWSIRDGNVFIDRPRE